MSTASPTLALTKALIERPSVTPEDADCQQLMAERLNALGFECQHLTFGEGQTNGPVSNLWAVKQGTAGAKAPLFCFAGHTDVVPVGDEKNWQHPPFTATEHNGLLYGRGAADMKGSLAAMITATEAFIEANPNHKNRIAFLITSDEEGPAEFGTVAVMEYLQQQGEQITWCLVGEPSSTDKVGDVVKNGRRGSLNGYLTVKGTQGHVAYPHLAENPIHSASTWLANISSREWDQGDAFFPPTSFQISNIKSGTGATNVIPGELEVVFNFRYSTQWNPQSLQQAVEESLQAHGVNHSLRWESSGLPFITEAGALVEAANNAIRTVNGCEPALLTTGGTSDGRFIAPTGAQVVELGPVNATIHKVDECVAIADLEQLSLMYQNILTSLC